MKYSIFILLILGIAVNARAYIEIDYDWEDGGTVLDIYPDPDLPSLIATNVTAEDGNQVYDGNHSLRLEHNETSGASVAILAYVWNLHQGDNISAGFWRYDDTPGALPVVRIAAHWNDELGENPGALDGLAGGNEDYGPGEGWDYTEWNWTASGGHTGLVIEARVDGEVGDVVWVDGLHISYDDELEYIYVQIPDSSPVSTEARTWSEVKSMYR